MFLKLKVSLKVSRIESLEVKTEQRYENTETTFEKWFLRMFPGLADTECVSKCDHTH
jgi:hypothetical protein